MLTIVSIICCTSCVSPRKITYFSDIGDSVKFKSVKQTQFFEPLIQSNDVLNISIQTIDPIESASLNQPGATAAAAGAVTTVTPGYLVDKEGNVELPVLGIVKIAGFTTTIARDSIRKVASRFFKNPTVQVRFANYKVTVVGEVARPGAYTVADEKVSLIDAIGLAGDLTIYGKRENVLLIRDNGPKKDFIHIDLTSVNFIDSPYFYLKQNDVIYVAPSKAKVDANSSSAFRITSIAIAAATLLVTLLTRL